MEFVPLALIMDLFLSNSVHIKIAIAKATPLNLRKPFKEKSDVLHLRDALLRSRKREKHQDAVSLPFILTFSFS